jgi:hypothetical protein
MSFLRQEGRVRSYLKNHSSDLYDSHLLNYSITMAKEQKELLSVSFWPLVPPSGGGICQFHSESLVRAKGMDLTNFKVGGEMQSYHVPDWQSARNICWAEPVTIRRAK